MKSQVILKTELGFWFKVAAIAGQTMATQEASQRRAMLWICHQLMM